MRISLEALETLVAIAEHGSFARAAEVLHRVPSALTYTVKKLESDLGVTLFDRSSRRPQLTAAGEGLLAQGRQLLRDAEAMEQRMHRVAGGWETRLRIAIDELVPLELLYPLLAEFYTLDAGTEITLSREVFGGGWDALIDHRADLVVGLAGDPPFGFGFSSRGIGNATLVFAVAPGHPLASAPEPVPAEEIRRHRAVVVADSSRRMPPRTAGALPDQAMLVVPSMQAKIEAQAAGLGCGFVPVHLAASWLEDGRLIQKKIDVVREAGGSRLAWRSGEEGRALIWFRDRLVELDLEQRLFSLKPRIASSRTVVAPSKRAAGKRPRRKPAT
jgi:DNA-binding transcriptional LysR family regulator